MSRIYLVFLALAVVLAAWIEPATAALISEDFSYVDGDEAMLRGRTGGTGWSGAWRSDGTNQILVDIDTNLASPLYSLRQTGTGLAYGTYAEFRSINRDVAQPLSGTVWFSALLQTNYAGTHAGLQFNHPGTGGVGYTTTNFEVSLDGTTLNMKYGGTSSPVASDLALGQTHLVLGRWSIGAGNDALELWVDPANPFALAPGVSFTGSDLGNTLSRIGVLAYRDSSLTPSGSFIDALRFSDGGGDPWQALIDVVGVPEPSACLLLVFGTAALVAWRRKRRVPSA